MDAEEYLNFVLNQTINKEYLHIHFTSYNIIDKLYKYFSSSIKLNSYKEISFYIDLETTFINKQFDLLFLLSEKYNTINRLVIEYDDYTCKAFKHKINKLSAEDIIRLSDFIKLNKLEYLELKYCFETFDNLELFCNALTNNISINKFVLRDCHFNNYTLSLLFNSLKSNNNINSLFIRYYNTFNNTILDNDKYLYYINILLKNNHNIINLQVKNIFNVNDAKCLSEILKYSSIQNLNLYGCCIDDKLFDIFYNSLKNNNNLTDLDLSWNKLTNISYLKVISLLKTNKTLISLNLDNLKNNDIEIFTNQLKENLKNNNTLMFLNIGGEFFGKRKDHTKSIMNLIETLKSNKSLMNIYLPTYIIRNKKYKKLFYDNLQEIRHIRLCCSYDEFYEI